MANWCNKQFKKTNEKLKSAFVNRHDTIFNYLSLCMYLCEPVITIKYGVQQVATWLQPMNNISTHKGHLILNNINNI